MWRRLGDKQVLPPAAAKPASPTSNDREEEPEEGFVLRQKTAAPEPVKKTMSIRLNKPAQAEYPKPAPEPVVPAATNSKPNLPASQAKPIDAKSRKQGNQKYGKQKKSPKTPYARDEWDPTHFRLFVGNLGQDVTTAVLNKAFEKYPSLSKSKVVVDARTGTTKGYGFVAFKDSADYLSGFQEMNGKFIGSKPVQLKKADANNKR